MQNRSMRPAISADPSHNWSRLDGVDLLRGLAIFFVLMNHVNMRLIGADVPYTQGLPSQLVSTLVWNGQFGVQIFFAISGFLITATTLRRWSSPSRTSIRSFYLLRFARIAPLLLLLLTILSALHLAHAAEFIVSSKTGGLPRALFAALTFHINLLEARRGYLPPAWDILWSLSVEETFYLFFPLLYRLFGNRRRLFALTLTLFVILGPFARSHAFNHNPVWREYSYLGGMDAIALGCLTALFATKHRLSQKIIRASASLGAALLIFILCFSERAYAWGLGRNGLNMSILAAATCMIILAAAQTRWSAPSLLAPLLRIGQRSYEVYLTHIFIVLALFHLFLTANKPLNFVPALFLAVILFSALLGELVARVYSEPMNRWLRRRLGQNPAIFQSVIEAAAPSIPTST
jgi:peptidoglycan/LPS O-acetylase OafA/YrhL